MRVKGRVWLGAFIWCLSLQVNADDQSAAFNDAKAYAQGTVDATGSIVSAEKAATLPHYTPNSPVPELVPGSVGLSGAGVGKIQGCQGQSDTECAAVNFLAKNPDQRLRFNIDPAADQTLQAARQVLANPAAVVGEVPLGTESACTTTTVTDPARYTTETCSSLRAFEGQQCTMGRVVNIDADANYQCDKTVTAFTSQQRQPVVSTASCVYGRQVDIDADSRFQCDQMVNAYETLKCRRGFSPGFGTQTQQLNPSFGDEVPEYTSKTFNQDADITGQSISARLTFFQADNFGQLWINDVLVYQGPWTAIAYGSGNNDLRNTYVTLDVVNPGDLDIYQYNLRRSNGNVISEFYQTYRYCTNECSGIPLDNDISYAFKKGTNKITMVCMNTFSKGPCKATISVTTVTVTGSVAQSTCGALEARAN